MAQIDLTIYRYALFLRSLIYQKQRHDENPDRQTDPHYSWSHEDEKIVAGLMVFLHLEVSSDFGSPLFYSQVLDAIQDLINHYHQVDISNRPPQEIVDAYERHLAEMEQAATTAAGLAIVQSTKKNLRRRLATTLPQVDLKTLDDLSTIIVSDAATTEPQKSVPQSIQVLDDTATVAGQAVSQEQLVATVSAAAPVWESASTDFAATKSTFFDKLAADTFTTNYLTTTVFSPSVSTIPSPKFEAAAVTATQSPALAARATQTLTDHQAQISGLIGQIRQAVSESSQIEAGIYKQLLLNPDLNKADLPQTFAVIQRYVLPSVLVGHTLAAQAGVAAEKIQAIDKFLAHIGYHQGLKELGITNVSASARMAAQKAAANLDFGQLFGSTTGTQIFYSARATSSPQMRAFLQDLQTLERVDFASVATVADKHFDLKGLDTSFDKYFTSPAIRDQARMQNFAGDVVAKFVPAARPIVAVLKPLNKLFFLVIDKTIGPVLTAIGKKIRNVLLVTFGVGAVSGVAVIYAGALAHRTFVFLGSLPAKTVGLFSAAGTAVLATFTSFLSITFIIFLSIPIAVALILFIINNSAYIVPQAVGIISGGISPAGCDLQCLQFSGFSTSEQAQIESAACTILANSCVASSLCAGGPITLSRVNRDVGYCGQQTQARAIEIYNGGVDGSKCSGLYTLSHELGHVFSDFDPSYNTTYATTVLPRRSSCLPTYELYDNNDPIACKVKGQSGSGEDKAEIMAQWFVNQTLLQQYTPQWELAQKELACTTVSSSSSQAYVLEGNLSDLVISKPSDINSPTPVCSWSARNTPAGGAVNANYFFSENGKLLPVGWAGDPALSSYRCGNACASLVFNGTSIQSISDRQTGGSQPAKAVSGLSLDAAAGQKTNRTALGIKGNTVYLVVVPNATSAQLKSVMSQLGVSQSLQLYGGSSSTLCQGGSLKSGSNATVPVSIGLRSATLSTYDLP